jgi:hypothetical protein
MEYLGFTLTEPSKIECNKITRSDFITRKLSDYNGMTAPVKTDSNVYKSIITFKYYFEVQHKYFEINSVSHALIKSQNGRMVFNPANPEAIKCITEILTEIDLLINQFCSHFVDIKDQIKYLSTAEIYSLSLVVLGGFLFKGET